LKLPFTVAQPTDNAGQYSTMSALADIERNFHVTILRYRNVVRRFSWIVVLMTHYYGPAKVTSNHLL
jgi:hypothetical protein